MLNCSELENLVDNSVPEASVAEGDFPAVPAADPLTTEFRWTIENVVQIREALLAALGRSDCLDLDFRLMTEIDLAGLQLLCAAHQSVVASGKRLVLRGRDTERFHNIIRNAGFLRTVGCSRDTQGTCLWAGGSSL